jgi:hypothetical protein
VGYPDPGRKGHIVLQRVFRSVDLFTHGAVPHMFKWRDYVPKWSEFAPTVMVITCALLAFPYAVIYLDVLVKNPPQSRWMMKGAVTEV